MSNYQITISEAEFVKQRTNPIEDEVALVVYERYQEGAFKQTTLVHLYNESVTFDKYTDPRSASVGLSNGHISNFDMSLEALLAVVERFGYAVSKPSEGLDLRTASDQELMDLAAYVPPFSSWNIEIRNELRKRSNLPVE